MDAVVLCNPNDQRVRTASPRAVMSTTVPWRLPQPPGLAPNATSMRDKSVGGGADESPTFSFQRRYHKLNWREVLQVDLGNIIQQIDLQTLHQQLEPITFADIGPDGR
jgi:hypothetical protein